MTRPPTTALAAVRTLALALAATAVTCLGGSPARAQGPTNPLSLAEALAWGVDNNLSVAGQRLGVEVAARNNNWVTAGRAPLVQATLGVSNSLNNQDNPAAFLNGTFYTGNATAGLQASYTLFNGYRVRFDRRRLGQLERQAGERVRQLVEESVFAVARAYYAAQLAAASRTVAEEALAISRDRLAYERLRRSYGQGASVDLLTARTNLYGDSIAVEQADVELDDALRGLALALDAEPGTFEGRPLGDTLAYEPRDWDLADVATRLDSTGALSVLRSDRALAATQTELARAALQPTVDLTAGLSHTRTAFQFLGDLPEGGQGPTGDLVFGSQGQGLVGVNAVYTLWDAGARRRTIENAMVQERVAELSLRNARQDADTEARNLLAAYRNQRDLLALREALIATARANLALGDEQLAIGAINSFDYRQLQLAYIQAEQARLRAVFDVLVTDLDLRRLTGRLLEG